MLCGRLVLFVSLEKGEEMKTNISIRKTVQETAYEPFSIEVSLDEEIPNTTKSNRILEIQAEIALLLQKSIEDILDDRAQIIERGKGKKR